MTASPAVAELWRRYAETHDTEYAPSQVLLDAGQQEWVRKFWSGGTSVIPDKWAVWLVGRQRGKFYTALMLAIEFALRTPGAVIRYCALTKDSAIGIVEPILRDILADCPKEIRPRVVSSPEDEDDGVLQRRRLWFPTTGAELVIFGTDAQSFRKGRGSKTHLQLFDECGFYQDFNSVDAALRPALQTTKGWSLYLSSPPESPGHPFVTRINAARPNGRLVHDTFWNNPRVDHEAIIREEAALRGQTREEFVASTYFRREYLAEIVVESTRAAVPAWTIEIEARCVVEWPRPKHYHAYTGHDWGGQTGDPHAALFGYVDFTKAKLIIEREHEKRGIDTKQLCDEWKALEVECWGERAWDGTLFGAGYFEEHTKSIPDFLKPALAARGPSQPFLRVCDNYQQLQKDMMVAGYAMLTTAKDDKHLMVDFVNVLVRQERIIIHPRCRRLLEQLQSTLWNEKRTEWVRTLKDHGDLIDCLVYICRNIFWDYDPRPPMPVDPWGQPPPKTGLEDLAAAMMGKRRR